MCDGYYNWKLKKQIIINHLEIIDFTIVLMRFIIRVCPRRLGSIAGIFFASAFCLFRCLNKSVSTDEADEDYSAYSGDNDNNQVFIRFLWLGAFVVY